MQCPKCESETLKAGNVKAKELELDQCPSCKGIWFDNGELSTLLGTKAAKDVDIPDASTMSPFVECPRCKLNLYEFRFPGTETTVDACEQCSGMWLDNKEWKVIQRAIKKSELEQHDAAHEPSYQVAKVESLQKSSDASANDNAIGTPHPKREKRSSADGVKRKREKRGSVQHDDEDMPGLKGTLLRTIEQIIHRLS